MRYHVWFIAVGLLCLLAGISVGFWFMTPMGGNLALLPTHVHLNLFGWVTLTLYGLIHNAFPELGQHRLARAQFWFAVVGGIALPIGFGLPRASAAHIPLIGGGALSGAIAAICFAIMFGRTVVFQRIANPASTHAGQRGMR
ncbi:MAG: hypothetical protein KGQ46_10760 [Hyphomicrobiales bacterium]|nr:hypothetical protein [Hyphomicrobiales bacterium]